MWNSIKSGRDHFELMVNRCHCLACLTWHLKESWRTVCVCVCEYTCVYMWGCGLLYYLDLKKSAFFRNMAHQNKTTLPTLFFFCFFYITLLVVHSKSVSSHLYRDVELLTGHEFLICARKWEGKDGQKNIHPQVHIFHMDALESSLFDSTPLQLKLWIMMWFFFFLTLPYILGINRYRFF